MDGFKRPKPAAARSRAIPLTPVQSGRLGVSSISIIGSSIPKILANGLPIIVSSGSSIIPSWSSDSSISRSDTSIPFDLTPLISAAFSLKSNPGIQLPAGANTPIMPTLEFGAPQTT